MRQGSLGKTILRRYKTNDCTIERLGELERDNPNGVLVLRDELIGLLASLDKEGREGDRAFYLEGFNGTGSYDTDRIMRGNIYIESHCLSVFGGIQPDKLIAYLEQANSGLGNDGLLQRFQLLVYPDPIEWQYRDRYPNKEAANAVFEIFPKLTLLSLAHTRLTTITNVLTFDSRLMHKRFMWSGHIGSIHKKSNKRKAVLFNNT